MSETRSTRPFAPFEWMLALRYLRSRRKETFISVIAGLSFTGIMLGVATLIVVMAVMNGFRAELLDKILGINGHVIVHPIDRPLTDFDATAKEIEKLDIVQFAAPFVEGQVLASGPKAARGALLRGWREKDLDRLVIVSRNVKSGSLDNFDGGEGVAIGSRLAAATGVRVGDKITLVSPKGNVTPFGVTPRTKAYTVSAIFEIGMAEYDAAFIFMPLEEAMAYLNKDDQVSAIDVFTDNPDKVGEYRPLIKGAITRPISMSDWRQRNVSFFSALQVERNVMFMILTLIILVAALNIISGLTMLVKDKSHDIAILRTMGATRGAVLRIFFMTGAAIGTFGTLAGLLLGTVICANIEPIRQFFSRLTQTELFSPELYFLSQLPARMETAEVVSVVIMALTLSFLATLYPAWRAAKLDPVEALRYE